MPEDVISVEEMSDRHGGACFAAIDASGDVVTSAYVVMSGGRDAPELVRDLASVGIDVVGAGNPGAMVQSVIQSAPDLVVCYETHPDDALFAGTSTLRSVAPRPVVVFTPDSDATKIERAAGSGIDAYVINGYGLHRLRAVIHVAQARFKYDQVLREELTEVQNRFNERKLLDRAKGILMRVRNVTEEEAYSTLRTNAMQTKQRIGQVAQQVIDAARFAEAVNRAGQLRMLSQRLVKLYALMCVGVTPDVTIGLCRASIEQVEANLAMLRRALSRATFGDLLDSVLKPWAALKAALAAAPDVAHLADIDRLAEALLRQSDVLTRELESAGFAGALQVINISGRQRMLSQRLAKAALMLGLAGADVAEAAIRADMARAEADFVEALAYLRRIPLTSPQIAALLDGAEGAWDKLKGALQTPDSAARADLAQLSETLLSQFEALTDLYERGMQILMS